MCNRQGALPMPQSGNRDLLGVELLAYAVSPADTGDRRRHPSRWQGDRQGRNRGDHLQLGTPNQSMIFRKCDDIRRDRTDPAMTCSLEWISCRCRC